MKRREFITLLGGAATVPLVAQAQQATKLVRVGRLSPLSEAAERPMLEGLRAGLAELGWVERKNLALDARFANGELDKLPALARDLAQQNPDVIVTGSNPAALATKNATESIPIVFVTTGDPVRSGIVSSLGRPGGNLTGIASLGNELNGKRLELLKEMFGLNRIAVLVNPDGPYTNDFTARREGFEKTMSIELPTIEVASPAAFTVAFERIAANRAGGILVLSDITFISHHRRIVELAGAHRLPAIYPDRVFVDAGGILFYGAALPDMYRQAAVIVDKILKGAKPASLPVEQPTEFRLIINLRAAKALGLVILEPWLARADEVIE